MNHLAKPRLSPLCAFHGNCRSGLSPPGRLLSQSFLRECQRSYETGSRDWNDDAELKRLGIAYAEATAEYLRLEKKAEKLYRVQVGAYRNRNNAEALAQKLKAAGFDAYITTQ